MGLGLHYQIYEHVEIRFIINIWGHLYHHHHQKTSCINAPAAWCRKCPQILRSLAATSASSRVHPVIRESRSRLMMSFQVVLGLPGFLFPWEGVHRYSLSGNRVMSRCPNQCRWPFLMTLDNWGWLVFLRMSMFVTYWDHLIFRIFLWHLMSNASSLFPSLSLYVGNFYTWICLTDFSFNRNHAILLKLGAFSTYTRLMKFVNFCL